MPTNTTDHIAPASRNLSTEAVVASAIGLVDAGGIDAATLGRVARDLGCHVTSLYTHVSSIDDLRVRMALLVQADLARRLWQAALGRSGVDAMRELAAVYRSFGRSSPNRMRLLFATTTTTDARFREGGHVLAEPIRATLRGFGLEGTQVVHAHRAFSAAMRGFLLTEAQGAYGDEADADETFEQIVTLFTSTLERGVWPVQH